MVTQDHQAMQSLEANDPLLERCLDKLQFLTNTIAGQYRYYQAPPPKHPQYRYHPNQQPSTPSAARDHNNTKRKASTVLESLETDCETTFESEEEEGQGLVDYKELDNPDSSLNLQDHRSDRQPTSDEEKDELDDDEDEDVDDEGREAIERGRRYTEENVDMPD